MTNAKNNIDMLNGSLWGKILKFSLVFMLTAFLQHLYGEADVIIVGRYAGQTALAGVGTCSHIVKLFLNFILGFSAGTVVVLGHAIGSGNTEQITKSAHTAMATAVCGGLVVTFVCFVFAIPLLKLMDVPDDVMPEALKYLRIVSLGFVPSLVYNFGAGILRAKGDTKRALYIVTASGIFNIVLNLMCVCVFSMGAAGVAVATVISQIYTAVAILYILCREQDETRIMLSKIRFYKHPFFKLVRYGVPSGIQSSVYSISNILVQSSVNGFGAAAIAGNSAAASITSFYGLMGGSLYQSSVVFTSQNFGAKKIDRIKKIAVVCFAYVAVFAAIQVSVTYFFGRNLIALYMPNDPMGQDFGCRKLFINGYYYWTLAISEVINGLLRGMGASVLSMVTAIAGTCGVRILWVLTAFKVIGTYESLIWCYPLSWMVTSIFALFVYVVIYKRNKKELGIM